MMKNPYTLIIGNKERDERLVSYKRLGSEENISMKLEDFIYMIKNEIKSR